MLDGVPLASTSWRMTSPEGRRFRVVESRGHQLPDSARITVAMRASFRKFRWRDSVMALKHLPLVWVGAETCV